VQVCYLSASAVADQQFGTHVMQTLTLLGGAGPHNFWGTASMTPYKYLPERWC
jgi:hypothetical protein